MTDVTSQQAWGVREIHHKTKRRKKEREKKNLFAKISASCLRACVYKFAQWCGHLSWRTPPLPLELVESNAMRRLWRGRRGRGLCISQLKGGAKLKCLAFQKWSDKNLKHGQQDMDGATPNRKKRGQSKRWAWQAKVAL